MLDARQSCPGAPFTFTQDGKAAHLKTAQLEVIVQLERGQPIVPDRQRRIAAERREQHSAHLRASRTEWRAHVPRHGPIFSHNLQRLLYGLGQHQNGMFNYRGATVELGQNNTDVAIPLLISSKGYGLMWNTAALTYFDNRFPLDLKLSCHRRQVDRLLLPLRAGDRRRSSTNTGP